MHCSEFAKRVAEAGQEAFEIGEVVLSEETHF